MNYFDDPNSKHFSFESFALGLNEGTFGVISFKGYEAISKPYDFEIMLVSSKKDIDFEDMLQSQAVFTIHRGANDDVLYNGILSEFDQLHEVNDVIFYRARLVPKLWWLTLTHHNQVFLNQSAPEFIDDALRDGGLETADIDIGTLNGYEEINYICQYDESHFNFVSRWMERQGIYYYFHQEADGEVMVLTDTKFSHYALKQGSDLFYNPASGLEGTHMGESINALTCRQKQLPSEIILKDYNYEKPSLDITSRASVDLRGRGISYIYGEFFSTPEEGERLAGIRAEELLCQKQEFFGESTVPYIMPGFTFNMHNHYRDDFNQEYLILEVTHEGNQSHLMSGGIAAEYAKGQNQAIYRNSFKAIPNEVQYRPERLTEKPKISGTIHAMIDSEVDGEYAQIDEQGRYRVKLPFDINDDHLDGKGSAPIRMMQSYAGKNRGMQFPLVKGTEVLLTFIEGNPDRPVIAGAVSNPETQGPVNAHNLSESVIQTGGNNKIRMEDKSGSERMVLESPASNSWVRIGTKNDPPNLNGSSGIYLEEGAAWEDPGAKIKVYSGSFFDYSYSDIFAEPADITLNGAQTAWNNTDAQVGDWEFTYRATNFYGGEEIIKRTLTVYANADDWADNPNDDNDGIRIRTAANLWMESQSRYAEYIQGTPAIDSLPRKLTSQTLEPSQLGDIRDNFGDGYSPTGMLNYKTKGSQTSFQRDVLAAAHVKLSSFDTVTTQEGNIYDFGGYWNYNLGNSYAEDHLDQSAELNDVHEYDLLNVGGPNFTGWRAVKNDEPHKRIARVSEISNHASNTSDWTNLWVQKTFGDSYEYTEGSSISVTKGGSQSVQIGGIHVEESYRGDGSRSSWSKSGKGRSEEKKYSKIGAILAHSISNNNGHGGLSAMEFSFAAKASHEYDFGASTKFAISANASSSLTLSASANIDISLSASLNTKIELEAAGNIHLQASVGPLIFISNGKVDIELPGFEFHFKAPVETTTSLTTLTNGLNVVGFVGNRVDSGLATISNKLVTLFN
jgi:type VI secretion system VgrG family protein